MARQRVTAKAGAPNVAGTALTQPFGMSWKDPVNDVGSGEISLPYGDPQESLLLPNGWTTFVVDDGAGALDAATIVAETFVAGVADPGMEGAMSIKASGRTHICEWERNRLQPEDGAYAQPIAQTRYFNFSSKYIDEAPWTPSVVPYSFPGMPYPFSPYAYPDGWPSITSSWTWSRLWSPGLYMSGTSNIADFSVANGTVYFRKHFTLADPTEIVIYATFDDLGELWLDNKLMIRAQATDAPVFGATFERVVTLLPGSHLIAGSVLNTGSGPSQVGGNIAGLACAVYKVTGSHVNAATPMFQTGPSDGFIWLDYPSGPPGFTPGKMVRIWRDEFVSRGGASWTLDFSDTLDSAGAAWSIAPQYALNIGMDGLTMLRQIGETDVDWYAVPGQRTLRMWNKGTRGTNRTATTTLSRATNLRVATRTIEV